MSEIHSALAENFSITQGGPMHRLLVRLGNAGDERSASSAEPWPSP